MKAHCYAELDVSSPAVTKTIASTVLIALTYGGMAKLRSMDEYRDGRHTEGAWSTIRVPASRNTVLELQGRTIQRGGRWVT